MIGRLEVLPGEGTVARFGEVALCAGPSASPGLLVFLVESARNVGAWPTGGRSIADHIAAVLANRSPEPEVPFATVGPGPGVPVVLLHGPIQLWDGARWIRADEAPGWRVVELGPVATVVVTPSGGPVPAARAPSVLDLRSGVVPGGGLAAVIETGTPSAAP